MASRYVTSTDYQINTCCHQDEYLSKGALIKKRAQQEERNHTKEES